MKTKRILCAVIVFTLALAFVPVITLAASAKDSQAQRFEYIVPMKHGEVNIVYEWELIITADINPSDISKYPNYKQSYAIYDFNGKNPVKYGVYNYITPLFGTDYKGDIYGVEYLLARIGEKEYLLDRKLKRTELPDNEKVVWFDNYYNLNNWLVTENGEYYKLKNIASNKEIIKYKKEIFSLPGDGPDENSSTAVYMTEDYMVFNTKLSTAVFSAGGKLLYRFEKKEFRIDMSYPFISNGYAVYYDKDNLCGIVDIYGNIIVQPKYQYMAIENGRLRVWEDGKSGLVDFDGNILIAMQDGIIDRITDDIYILSNYDNKGKARGCKIVSLSEPDKYKNFSYDYIGLINYEAGLLAIQKGGKYGIASFDGTVIVPPKYDSLGDVYYSQYYDSVDGGMVVGMGKDYERKYGLIDSNGNEILPVVYDRIGSFSEGLRSVEYWGDPDPDGYGYPGKYTAFVDKDGKEAFRLENDMYYPASFSEGLSFAHKGDPDFGGCVYFDKTGKIVISGGGWSNTAYPFKNGVAITTNYISGYHNIGHDIYYGVIKYIPPKVGDVMGDVLYSDITAYVNGEAIPTSVINGKTLVVVEDLAKYGFDVKWDGNERTLKVELNKNKKFNPILTEKDTTHKLGTFKCNYLYTDIKTYLSGELVESYAIDGVTLIDFELLNKYGKLKWDSKARELRLVIGVI